MTEAPHIPVLLNEVMDALAPIDAAVMLDGTFGAGGYTSALLNAGAAHVIAIDRDPNAIAGGATIQAQVGDRLTLIHGDFARLDEHARGEPLDGIVLDIGVSSMQLDQADRGFSFRADGPLDMRMSEQGLSAADLVNQLSERDLAQLIYVLGEDKNSRRIAKAIVAQRDEAAFTSTLELAQLIEKTVGRRPQDRIHPATTTFQALRIAVNDELGQLVSALAAAERCLQPGGCLAVVTFHSLEDRIVKRFFAERSGRQATGSRHLPQQAADAPTFELLNRKPIEADERERERNPRARSARLRAVRRLNSPARAIDARSMGLPQLGITFPKGSDR